MFRKSEDVSVSIREVELERLARLLLSKHRPPPAGLGKPAAAAAPSTAPAPVPPPCPPAPEPEPVRTAPLPAAPPSALARPKECRNCHGQNLTVQFGKRYGYHFKCQDCGGATPIEVRCDTEGCQRRIRKEGPRFFAECAKCGTSELYHVNGPD